MDYLQKYFRQFRSRLFLLLLANNLLIAVDWYVADKLVRLAGFWLLGALLIAPVLSLSILPWLTARALGQPTKLLWQAILHIAPGAASIAAPKPDQLHFGRELVTSLINQIYQVASVVDKLEKTNELATHDLHSNFIASSLPLPLFVLDKQEKIVYANDAALHYVKKEANEVIGQEAYAILDMSFTTDNTFDTWLKHAKENTVSDSQSWERVRIGQPDDGNSSLLFDLSAFYNKDNTLGYETLLVIFDHTQAYSQDDQAMGFVALSVHELRTPLTLLRGYIEAFDEELGPTLNDELKDFMRKMNASAQQLAAFVDNILNVAKIEDNQLTLQLHDEEWKAIVDGVVSDISLRAHVRGIEIKTDIPADLPHVGADRYSIYEVLANLIDNAIKYSGNTKEIIIKSTLTNDGEIETTVQDTGVGIPENVIPHIFDKFYRNHRNRAQIGGTGLGLYLSKAIVTAHGGQIWVRSKEGEGSTFGFTILPFSSLAEEQKNSDNGDIVRGAHGWIKNHSLYRR